MFCIECGVQIPDHSKFCSQCGVKQTEDEFSINEETNPHNIQSKSLRREFKNNFLFDFKFLRDVTVYYVIWVLSHLFILLVFSDWLFSSDYVRESSYYRFWLFMNVKSFLTADLQNIMI